jgi:hypothetical protein
MDIRVRRTILERRVAMLQGHLWVRAQQDYEAAEPLCEAELDKAEAELRELEQREATPPGS